jgi:hypothetical protein
MGRKNDIDKLLTKERDAQRTAYTLESERLSDRHRGDLRRLQVLLFFILMLVAYLI